MFGGCEERLRSAPDKEHDKQRSLLHRSACVGLGVISPPTRFDEDTAASVRRAVSLQSRTEVCTGHVTRLLIVCSWWFDTSPVCLVMGYIAQQLGPPVGLGHVVSPASIRGPVLPNDTT